MQACWLSRCIHRSPCRNCGLPLQSVINLSSNCPGLLMLVLRALPKADKRSGCLQGDIWPAKLANRRCPLLNFCESRCQ